MMNLTNYIISRKVPLGENIKSPVFRNRVGIIQGWISIVINLVLFGVKIVVGYLFNSIALIADAFHSLSDMASSIVVIFGFKMSSKPADNEHPFGHGRAETIASLTIAMLIGCAGLEFVKTSIHRLTIPADIEVNWLLFLVVIFTIIIKEWLARFSIDLGEKINSDTLRAEAVHHRSDMLSSVLVLVAAMGVWLNYPRLDAIMGLGIAAIMLFFAYNIATSAIDDLLGKPLNKETYECIQQTAMQVDGVLNIHDIVVHSYGVQKFISLHVEIAEGNNPESMHTIADEVEKRLSNEMQAEIVTHVDPITIEGEDINLIQRIIKRQLKLHNIESKIQDLRIVKNKTIESIMFEIPVPIGFDRKDQYEKQCINELTKEYPECKVMIEYKQQINFR